MFPARFTNHCSVLSAVVSIIGVNGPNNAAAPAPAIRQAPAPASLRQAVPDWARGVVINQVPVAKPDKVIALTFDDGPNAPYTGKILRVLREHHARATFFLLGAELHASPSLGREIRDEGHAIGNHSWSHPIRPKDAASEVKRTDDEIRTQLQVDTTLFRPPYGIMTNGLSRAAQSRSEAVLLWSVDTNDWKRPGAKRIATRVINGAKPGRIVLMHDGGGNRSQTVAALPVILDTLAKRGYRFVTIPELLLMRRQEVKASKPSPARPSPAKSASAPLRPTLRP